MDILFYCENTDATTSIEIKKQYSAGSVVQKFPYYKDNAMDGCYLGNFLAIFDCPAAGLKPLNYFYKKALENKFGFIQSIDQLTMKTLIEPSSVVIKPTIKSSDISTIIKWAGSKKSIVDILFKHFPPSFNNYYEPFLGTAVVFMEAKNKGILTDNTNCYLNDSLFPLINTYESIRDNHKLVIEEFSSKDTIN